MNKFTEYNPIQKPIRTVLLGLISVSLLAAPTLYAAEEDEEEADEATVTITGSRIKRTEFSSSSPIQIISGDLSRELGLFDASEMLQNTNQASGFQIDNTFGGFVIDNGPGSATIGFRGLGADRTLVMINGRRMAPAGVGGAPVAADLNLIPGAMIDRVENLLDGASTIYGSDALAGVANVILKTDVEGFQIQAQKTKPNGQGADETIVSGMWGSTSDNGFISVGFELAKRNAQSRAGNPFAKGCEERIWETETGEQITRYSGNGPTISGENSCYMYPLGGRMQINNGFWGTVYYTPNYTNTGIPNFSETTVPTDYIGLFPSWIGADFDGDGIDDGAIVDGNGDGYRDVDFQDPRYNFTQSDYYKGGDYLSKLERMSVLINGEYNFKDNNNTSFYYDALVSKRKTPIFSPGSQIFEWVPSSNPYNVCNPEGLAGIDCFGVLGFGDAGPLLTRPILNIRGDRDQHDIEVSQNRLVTGLKGDLGFVSDTWYYDVYASYSSSNGTYKTVGISEDRLLNSLNTSVVNSDGSVTCGDGTDGCVPVNMFSANMYQIGGAVLKPDEYNYLMVERFTQTRVSQLIVNGFIGGELFKLPWNGNEVNAIFGVEYRREEIKSHPNEVASEGLLWGWFSDKGATGARNLKEAYAEVDLPLLAGLTGVEELSVSASARITKESYYDASNTYNIKSTYRPVEWFTLRGTKGTSYRAPNLRERFLSGTSGFNTLTDPCVVPSDARISDPFDLGAADVYDAANDSRDQGDLDACVVAGVDPTALGLGENGTEKFNSSYSVEIVKGGTTELVEETSEATTAGVIFEQPFSEAFDLTLSATIFDIEVSNSIAEPSASYSMGQCYSADGNTAFCDRLNRDSDGKIALVDASFINIGLLTSKGIDYNLYYHQGFVVMDKNLGVSFDVQATRMDESLYDVLDTVDDNAGETDVPKWRASTRLSLSYNDFRLNWATRFIGGGEGDDLGDFIEGTSGCRGLYDDAGDPLLCRPVGYTEDYTIHNLSLTWEHDNFLVSLGVRNILNEAPPKMDESYFTYTNIPLGVGYDTFGRTPYLNFLINL